MIHLAAIRTGFRRSPVFWLILSLGILLIWRLTVVIASDLPLFGDEAQYWAWSQKLSFGYVSKPPLIAWTIALFTYLFGDEPWAVRLAAPLLHGGAAILIFLLGRELYGRKALTISALAALLYATAPAVSLSSFVMSTDSILMPLWAFAMLALARAFKDKGLIWWALCGIALGLGLNAKYTMVFFVIGLALHIVVPSLSLAAPHRWTYQAVILTGLIALTLILPNLIWNSLNDFSTLAHTVANANLQSRLLRPEKALEFLGAQLGVFGPVSCVALFVVLGQRLLDWIRRHEGEAVCSAWRPAWGESFLLPFIWPVLLLILIQALLSRAHANWAAMAYIGSALLVAPVLYQRRYRIVMALGLNIMVAVVGYHHDAISRALSLSEPLGFDPWARLRGWDSLADVVSYDLANYPDMRLLADDRMLLANLIYHIRPHPWDAGKWNPDRRRVNHYDVMADIADARGQDFLLIARHGRLDSYQAYFEAVSSLPPIMIPDMPAGQGLYHRALLFGFHGYPNP